MEGKAADNVKNKGVSGATSSSAQRLCKTMCQIGGAREVEVQNAQKGKSM